MKKAFSDQQSAFSGVPRRSQAKAGLVLLLVLSLFLPAVSVLRAQAAGTPSITLNWAASSGVVSNYFVERSAVTNGVFTEIATIGPVTTYTDTNVVQGTWYFYRVRAGNPKGKSEYSNTAGTLFLLLPGNPGTLTLTIQQ
jgi:hypothetical protein